MKRTLSRYLLEWKNSPRRKPLLLQGARQVGKTWLINDFGRREYEDYVYLNFEQNPALRTLFSGNLAPDQIVHNISLFLGRKIKAANTLICFDEIQAVPEAITSLKYFHEQAPEYHLIAAGSLLGVQFGKTGSFPVGKVNFMTLHPLSFAEYLDAVGEELLLEQLRNLSTIEPLPGLIHEKLLSLLKTYLFIGGMPEVVQNYLDNQDIAEVRAIQQEILEAYRRDFSKYTDTSQTQKTSEVWQSIPFQLARENKKFKYSDVRSKGRASMFEQAIEWLKNAGLVHLAFLLRTPKLPLAGYADYEKFKVYLLDTGLLGAMLDLSSELIVQPNQLFAEYNGSFMENFVATELVKESGPDLFYWTSQGQAEVDFIISHKNDLYPIEVKSGTSRKTGSLRSYAEKYDPRLLFRISPRNLIHDRAFINVPLYATFILPAILDRFSEKKTG